MLLTPSLETTDPDERELRCDETPDRQ